MEYALPTVDGNGTYLHSELNKTVTSTYSILNSTDTSNQVDLLSAVFAGCLVGIIILVIIFGNTMVILAVVKDRHLKHALQNRFIVSLAVADLLLGALIMPLSLHLEILKYWALGNILCDIWLAMDVFLCTASTLSLVVVSLDRYWSVTKALEYPQLRTSRKVNISIAGIWLTSALVSLPPLAGWKSNSPSKDDSFPQCNLSDELGYIVYSLTISFYIPLIIILLAYGRIFVVARNRANQQIKLGTIHSVPPSANNNGPANAKEDNISITQGELRAKGISLESIANSQLSLHSTEQNQLKKTTTHNQNSELSKHRNSNDTDSKKAPRRKIGLLAQKFFHKHSDQHGANDALLTNNHTRQQKRYKASRGREKRATITIAILVMVFVICWLPFSTLYLIDRLCLCGIRDNIAFTVIFWMGYCNSAVNPILYSIFNRDFRQAFHRLLCQRYK